ncbi:Actin-related protein 2/3 complex subunit 3 [Halotydeus destructor]|nr:Actin-related protein 2/3 complex subunit 3 [Halotydeus destructor]
MPAYHSKIPDDEMVIGNTPLLTFRTKFRGPVLTLLDEHLVEGKDIIDEAFFYFKSNVFFKTFDIQHNSDRILVYLTLYIIDCLKRLTEAKNKDSASKELFALAISRFDIPGDPNFILNNVYKSPKTPEELDQLRLYFLQLRQECGRRLVEKYGFERVGRPQQIYYTLPGVNVNLLQSSEEKVILQKVTRDSSGLYRCEVTTERSFQPLVGEGTMTITSATSSGLKNHRSSAAAPPRKGTFFPLFYLAEKCITVTTLLYYMYAMVNLFQGLQNA